MSHDVMNGFHGKDERSHPVCAILRSSCAAPALVALMVMAMTALDSLPSIAADRRDPKAVEVASAVEKATAPGDAWQKMAGLRFTFGVVREGKPGRAYDHLWDTRSGRYRVEGDGPGKKKCVVIFDTATKKGDAWVLEPAAGSGDSAAPGGAGGASSTGGPGSAGGGGGSGATSTGGTAGAGASPSADTAKTPGVARWVKQQGETATKLLEFAYGRFINDTYWLLMPLKMRDPGVNLDYDGRKDLEGKPHDVLKLTFNGVGLTPGDTYWVWVDPESHLVDHWEFVLEGQTEKDRGVFDWKDWQTVGPLRLSTSKPMAGGKIAIVFTGVAALDAMPPGAFDPPQ